MYIHAGVHRKRDYNFFIYSGRCYSCTYIHYIHVHTLMEDNTNELLES